jgi:hypothetical protein
MSILLCLSAESRAMRLFFVLLIDTTCNAFNVSSRRVLRAFGTCEGVESEDVSVDELRC